MRRRGTSLPPPYLKRVEVDPAKLEGRTGYPFDLPLIRDGLELRFERPVTIVVGDNGSGKSTLLEAIAELAGFAAVGGNRNHRSATTGDDRRLAEELGREGTGSPDRLRALRNEGRLAEVLRAGWLPKVTDGFFFRAETFFDLARYLDESSLYGGGSAPRHLHKSHAEGFLDFFAQRLASVLRSGRPSLFLFDEPESALAPHRQLEFMRWVQRIERSGRGQVIVATHSPILMAQPGADLRQLAEGVVRPVDLEQVEHFRMLQEFFGDPHGLVDNALADEDPG